MLLLQTSGASSGLMQLVFFIPMIFIFYFFMIRPQQKRQKEQKSFVENLQTGDYIVTLGGIHGKIISLDGLTALIEVDKGVKLKIDRSAISYEQTKTVQANKEAKETAKS